MITCVFNIKNTNDKIQYSIILPNKQVSTIKEGKGFKALSVE